MGHDITAYEFSPDKKREIVYLRRTAFSSDRHKIYEYLEANFADANCSGDGTYNYFELKELREALKLAKKDKAFSDIIEFLQKCVNKAEAWDGVLIHFA